MFARAVSRLPRCRLLKVSKGLLGSSGARTSSATEFAKWCGQCLIINPALL